MSTSAFAAAAAAISSFGAAGRPVTVSASTREDDGRHASARGSTRQHRRRSVSASSPKYCGGCLPPLGRSPSSSVASDLGVRMDVDRDDLVEVDAHASSSRPSLITGVAVAVRATRSRSRRRPARPASSRCRREERRGEANGEPSDPGRIADVGGLENGAAGERHRAEAVDDSSGQADCPRELVVEVDREVRRPTLPHSDRSGPRRSGRRPRRADRSPCASSRWSGARSPMLSSASTPRKNSVTYCSFTSVAVFVARLRLDHERRPVRTREQRDRRRSRRRVSFRPRSDDGGRCRARSGRRAYAPRPTRPKRRRRDRLPDGHDGEDRAARTSVAAASPRRPRGVRTPRSPSSVDGVALLVPRAELLRGLRSRRSHDVIPVV